MKVIVVSFIIVPITNFLWQSGVVFSLIVVVLNGKVLLITNMSFRERGSENKVK
jgi:hypothetical protein